MKISIITVCYNSSSYIRTAIESVLSQSHSNIEYIVIDGGSTDGTLKIINEYADRIARIVSKPDKGIYDAMNKGIALASGDVIGILNSDDFYLHSDALATVSELFEQNSDIDLVLSNVDFVKASDLTRVVRKYSSFNFSPWKLRFGFMPAHPGTFIKRTVYEQVGQYELGYKIAADYEMFIRMLLVNKFPYIKVNRTLVRMRIGGISTATAGGHSIISHEILRAFKENDIYSNIAFISIRLPIKFMQLILGCGLNCTNI